MTSHFMQPLGTISLHTQKLSDMLNGNWPPKSQSVNPNLVCGPAHNYLNQILTITNTKSIFNIRPNNNDKENNQTQIQTTALNKEKTPHQTSTNQPINDSPQSSIQPLEESNITPPNSPNVNSPLSLSSPVIWNSFSNIVKMEEENVAPPISSSSSFSESSSSLPTVLLSPYHANYSKDSTKISNSARKGNDRPVSDSNFSKRKKCKRNLEDELDADEEDDVAFSHLSSDDEFEDFHSTDDDDEEITDEDDDVIVVDSDDDNDNKKRKIKPLLKVKRSPVKKQQKDVKKKKVLKEVKKRNNKSKTNQKKENDDKENQPNGKRKYQRKSEKKEKKVVPQKKQKAEEELKGEVKQDPKNNEVTPAGKSRVRHFMKKRDNGSEPWIHQTQLNPPVIGKMRQGIISFPEGVKHEMTITYSTKRLKSDCTSNIFWSLQDRLGRRVKETFAEKNNNELQVKVPKSKDATVIETFLHTFRQNTTSKPNFEVTIKVKNESSGEEVVLSRFSTAVHSHKYESSSSGKKSDQTHGVLMDVVDFV